MYDLYYIFIILVIPVTTSILVVLAVFLINCPTAVDSISKDDMNKIKSGLEAGEAIARLLESKQFGSSLSKITFSAGPYLGAVGAFVGFISALNPSESAELVYMKRMMKAIDRRLDLFDYQFDRIVRLITWSVIQVNFGQIEQKIKAMSLELEDLYNVPPSAVKNRKLIFIKKYDSDYQNSGLKLYLFIVQKYSTFQKNLGIAVMHFTKNDRRKTQIFLLGVMQLLLQAAKLELAYLSVHKYYSNAEYMKVRWTNRIQEVRQKFEHIDNQCKNEYHSESGKDIDEYSLGNRGKTNQSFATELWKLLCSKYYWRDWVVVVYDPIWGYDHHTVRVSGGHIKFRKDGRNILVASVDKRHPVMNVGRAEQQMKKVSMTYLYRAKGWLTRARHKRHSARHIFNSLDKTGASLVSVIRCNAHVGFITYTTRFRAVSRCPDNYLLIMWG